MTSEKQYASYEGIRLILNEVVVAEHVDVGSQRIEEQEWKDIDVEPYWNGRMQRYPLYLWTLDEQRCRGWRRPGETHRTGRNVSTMKIRMRVIAAYDLTLQRS